MTIALASLPPRARLGRADLGAIMRLYDRCTDYFILQDGQPPSMADAADLFDDVPDQRTNDQLVFGWSAGSDLFAVAAILPNYPDAGIWYLGLFIIDPAARGCGIGRTIYSQLAQTASKAGAREIRLATLEVNETARAFWQTLGFRARRRTGPDTFKIRRHYRIELCADVAV